MSEPLERWAPRVASALERVPRSAVAALRELADERARAVRGPRHLRIRSAVRGDLAGGTVELSAEGAGAPLLERGGRVDGRPWLAVPTSPRVTASGPRRDGDLFPLRLRDGRVFLASRRGGGLDLRWRLVRSVTVRGQRFVEREANRAAEQLPETVADALRDELGVRS